MTEFTGTREVAEEHRFDALALEQWLAQNVADFKPPLHIAQFRGGQSNPTFRLTTPARSYVMRAKPGPASKLLASAHAIEREYRVMQALAGSDVPVPEMLAICEDESVIGRAFFIMEFIEGRVFWDLALPALSRSERGPVFDEMNRVIAALHSFDFKKAGLGDYGRPGNYFERQISRWSKQYQASVTGPNPAMDALIGWLPDHIPASARDESRASIVHGDYRIDNLIFHPSEPRVLAVLDWELSTIGHPFGDFGYNCMAWHIEPSLFRGIGGLDLAALGIPAEDDYMRAYCNRTEPDAYDILRADWNFYLAYNLFRIAAIAQGIAKRIEVGTAASAQARATGALSKPLSELAWRFARKSRS